MSFDKETIRDIDVKGKRVLVRVDYNLPLDEQGRITDDYRIKKSLPTLQYLLKNGASLILCSHLGRPNGKKDMNFSLKPAAARLQKLIGQDVIFAPDCIGEATTKLATELKPGEILLLENLRFYPEEESNNADFAKQLASLAEVFVQDGFGVVHRSHASTDAITRYLPSVAGLLLENEVDTITNVMENPARPLMAIIGGAKITDKLPILKRLIDVADIVAIGGAMANTFLLADGVDIGKSKADEEDVPVAKMIIERARAKSKKQPFTLYLPQDGVVATSLDKTAETRIVDWDDHVFATIESYPKQPSRRSAQVLKNEMILDIGPFSGAFIAGSMQLASTVIWNGTMGVTETSAIIGPVGPFA
ncbi:MAG: phosphoglycerate kinase, partial [Candidatus Saccharimonadales bacterium]